MGTRLRGTPLERILPRVCVKPSGCWEWTGGVNHRGYGIVKIGGKSYRVHRLFYELTVGPIGEGYELDHTCRNHRCINPDHLEQVTHTENMRRGYYALKECCPKGHPYNEENTYVRPDGRRKCRLCARDASSKWRASKREI